MDLPAKPVIFHARVAYQVQQMHAQNAMIHQKNYKIKLAQLPVQLDFLKIQAQAFVYNVNLNVRVVQMKNHVLAV